jgi:cyclopropane fatty-acyl-phospholipid synthase-like methyltransferase
MVGAGRARKQTARASSVNIYTDGEYLKKNPTWHVEESSFKAKYILELLKRNNLSPRTICDAGCGAGEVLRQLQLQLRPDREFWGYDISPQAYELCKPRENEKLHFRLANVPKERGVFDLLLVLDVVEHLEDYFSFLREICQLAESKIFHFPLDLSAQTVLRRNGLINTREMYGHLHYFTKETALRTLTDTGYNVIDYFYAPRSNELGSQFTQKLLRFPRAFLYAIREDLAVRVLGGYSLMVLAR